MRNKITYIDGSVKIIEGSNAFELYSKFKKETSGVKGWMLESPILKKSKKALREAYIIAENMPNFNQVEWVKENIIFDSYADVDKILVKMFLDETIFYCYDIVSKSERERKKEEASLVKGDISFDETKLYNIIQAIPLDSLEVASEKWLWNIEAPSISFSSYLRTKYAIKTDALIRMNKGGQRMKAGNNKKNAKDIEEIASIEDIYLHNLLNMS